MSLNFSTMHLNPCLIAGLKKQNIQAPTLVQAKTFPSFVEGHDLIVESYTGSGKTLAYLLPLFEKINVSENKTQAIILAPTHELVIQIHRQIELLSQNSSLAIKSQVLMGEMNLERQIKKLKEKPHIVVGSAGRILDLLLRKKLSTSYIHTLILDEGDSLLTQDENKTILQIYHILPKPIQCCICSASISLKALHLAKEITQNPIHIQATPNTLLNPNIFHTYIIGQKRKKFELLHKLIVKYSPQKCLIFISQHTNAKDLVSKLNYNHLKAGFISGKIAKEARQAALRQFKKGDLNILVTSDLTARGLDIPDITHIFHFDPPLTSEDYLHRAGRTARGFSSGHSICILTPSESGAIRIYERELKIKFHFIDMSNLKCEVQEKRPSTKPVSSSPIPNPSKKKTVSKKKAKILTPDTLPKGTLEDALKLIAQEDF